MKIIFYLKEGHRFDMGQCDCFLFETPAYKKRTNSEKGRRLVLLD